MVAIFIISLCDASSKRTPANLAGFTPSCTNVFVAPLALWTIRKFIILQTQSAAAARLLDHLFLRGNRNFVLLLFAINATIAGCLLASFPSLFRRILTKPNLFLVTVSTGMYDPSSRHAASSQYQNTPPPSSSPTTRVSHQGHFLLVVFLLSHTIVREPHSALSLAALSRDAAILDQFPDENHFIILRNRHKQTHVSETYVGNP